MFTAETPPALQQQILAMMLKAPEPTAVGAMAAITDPAIWTDDVIPVPVLAVYAGTLTLPDAGALTAIAPRYEQAQIPGTGHFLMMEKPEEFNRLLGGFLRRLAF
jgi:pimeloyl-ACP methyl ester carboxylesterase